jgi:hypothetical protein
LTDWMAINADPSLFLAKQIGWLSSVKRQVLKWLTSWRRKQSEVKKALTSKEGIERWIEIERKRKTLTPSKR